MTRVLLLGPNGQVGFELAKRLSGFTELVVAGRDQVDLSEPSSMQRTIRELKPELIVNAAAYTAVDRAEVEPELAMAVNAVAPAVLAEEALRHSAALIHYSTDYVFDGLKHGAYVEDDPPAPLNSYGRSKLAGERAITESGAPHLILRTSWVYGTRGGNFMLTMLRLARERERIQVVNDQFGVPTSSSWLAQVTTEIVAQLSRASGGIAGAMAERSGVYHVVPAGSASWFDFAKSIVTNAVQSSKTAARLQLHTAAVIEPIRTDQYPVSTPRPKNSVLSSAKAARTFGIDVPQWQTLLDNCMSVA